MAFSASMLTTSSRLAHPFRMQTDGKWMAPRSNKALAAASKGHGPFSFCSNIFRSLPCQLILLLHETNRIFGWIGWVSAWVRLCGVNYASWRMENRTWTYKHGNQTKMNELLVRSETPLLFRLHAFRMFHHKHGNNPKSSHPQKKTWILRLIWFSFINLPDTEHFSICRPL